MRIGLEHIDAIIAAAMRDRLCTPGISFLKDNIRWAEAEETSLIRLFFNKALRRPEQRPPDDEERRRLSGASSAGKDGVSAWLCHARRLAHRRRPDRHDVLPVGKQSLAWRRDRYPDRHHRRW